MRPPLRSSGILLAALVLLGAGGPVDTACAAQAGQAQRLRAAQAARERRIAQLTPQARAGDPAATTALAFALMVALPPDQPDLAHARALLERAAGQGHLQAQAILGNMLVAGRAPSGVYDFAPATPMDRPRGIALLQKAASAACQVSAQGDPEAGGYTGMGFGVIQPALQASRYLEREQRYQDAQLWRARSIVHCAVLDTSVPAAQVAGQDATPGKRIDALALLLLAGEDGILFQRLAAAMTADDIATARVQAAALRLQVAQSERDYPAPPSRR